MIEYIVVEVWIKQRSLIVINFLPPEGQEIIWCGDFNAHNTLWGGDRIAHNGLVVEELMDMKKLSMFK